MLLRLDLAPLLLLDAADTISFKLKIHINGPVAVVAGWAVGG
jgi:hypothetical protein